MAEDSKIKLHQFLVDQKVYTKSYEDFDVQFSTPEKQSSLHQFMVKNKLYTKDSTAFQGQFFNGVAKKKADTTTGGKRGLFDPLAEPVGPPEEGRIGTGEVMAAQEQQAPLEPQEQVVEPATKQGRFTSFFGAINQRFYGLPGEALKAIAIGGSKIESLIEGKELDAQEDPLYKAGQWYQDQVEEIAPRNKEYQGELQESIGQAIGDLAGLVVGGAITRGVTTGSQMAVLATKAGVPVVEAAKMVAKGMISPEGIIGATQMGVSEYEQAKAGGASDEDAFDLFIKNAAVGSVLERMPVQLFWRRLDTVTGGGMKTLLKKGFSGGMEEGITEIMQQAYSNKLAQEVYDETRTIIDGMGEAGGIGFGLGFVLNAMGVRLRGLKSEATSKEDIAKIQEAIDLTTEKQNEVNKEADKITKVQKDAIQKRKAEEVPVREEAEVSEEVVEEIREQAPTEAEIIKEEVVTEEAQPEVVKVAPTEQAAVEKFPEVSPLEQDLSKVKLPKKSEKIDIREAHGELNIKPIKKKVTIKATDEAIMNTADKDPLRPSMQGIYYDVDNKVKVTTDGHVLTVIPDKSIKGKNRIINPTTGKEIDEKFPDYVQAIPLNNDQVIKGVDPNELLEQARGQTKANKFTKDENIRSIIEMSDGTPIGFNPSMVERGITALMESGTTEVNIEASEVNRAMIIRDANNPKKFALIMPIMLEEGKFLYSKLSNRKFTQDKRVTIKKLEAQKKTDLPPLRMDYHTKALAKAEALPDTDPSKKESIKYETEQLKKYQAEEVKRIAEIDKKIKKLQGEIEPKPEKKVEPKPVEVEKAQKARQEIEGKLKEEREVATGKVVLETQDYIPIKNLKGKEVKMEVEVEETGKMETITMSAVEVQNDIKKRHKILEKLTDCVG